MSVFMISVLFEKKKLFVNVYMFGCGGVVQRDLRLMLSVLVRCDA